MVGPGEIGFEVRRAVDVESSVSAPVSAIAAAGSCAGLLLLGAAGALWVERRRQEVALLTARGVSPLSVAGRAATEMLLPVLVGGAAGWGLGLYLVPALGPGQTLEPGAPWRRWRGPAGRSRWGCC